MKFIAFSTFLSFASASASSFQPAQRLRGVLETRELQGCVVDRSELAGCEASIGSQGQAYKPTSTESGFTLDGTLTNWDALTNCPGIPMYEAGVQDGSKTLASRAYLNWECATGDLCVLIKAEPEIAFHDDDGMWFKNYIDGASNQAPIGGSVTKITDTGTETGKIIAWEACYSMLAACTTAVQFHANYDFITDGSESRTTSTGKNGKSNANPIALDLSCPCTDPVDCEINACYSTSTCVPKTTCTLDGTSCVDPTSTTSICDYELAYDNCCTADEDCDVGSTCNDISEGTGTCQAPSPTPTPTAPTPTAPSGPTAPAPTGPSVSAPTSGGEEEPECSIATVATDCSLGENHHPQCASPVCSDTGSCGVVKDHENGEGGSCVKDNANEVNNSCYIPKCNGLECEDAWELENQPCSYNGAVDVKWDSSCVEYKCRFVDGSGNTERTTCQAVYKPATTLCGEAPGSRGDCDSGNKCDPETGYCSPVNSFMPEGEVCRPSAEGKDCDKPEACTGASHVCPTNVNYGPEDNHMCRAKCEDGNCLDDIPEVCPGGDVDVCPDDIIFQKTLDVLAGQHHDAGSTTITATEKNNEVEICVEINLDASWALQGVDEAVKLEINTSGAPKSAPGSYTYKYANLDAMAGQNCYSFADGDFCTVYFALHLDVVGPEGTETAWAKSTAASSDDETSLLSHEFVKQGTSKGPKVKSTTTGWGNYFSFSICCANVDTCDDAPVSGGGTTTEPTTATGPTGSGSSGDPTAYTCTNVDNTHSINCLHAAPAAEGDVTCTNLFS